MDPSLFQAPAIADAVEHFVHAIESSSGSALGKVGTNWIVGQLERFYKKHLKDDDGETQVVSMCRLLELYGDLDARLVDLEESGYTSEALRKAFSDPQASRLIEAACIAVTETDDATKRDTLARLVAARVVAKNESRHAIYLRIATEAVRDLQPRHLVILGQMFLVQWVPFPPLPNDGREVIDIYAEWLDKTLQRLDTIDATLEDMAHLQSLSMLVPGTPSSVMENEQTLPTHGNPFVYSLTTRGLPEQALMQSASVKRAARLLDARMDLFSRDLDRIALGDYELTGAGQILAIGVMRERGIEFDVNLAVYEDLGKAPELR
jgi:hypothetical protein